MNDAYNAISKHKRANEHKFKSLNIKNIKNECSNKESKMCIILNEKDDKLADKFKKDPVKF